MRKKLKQALQAYLLTDSEGRRRHRRAPLGVSVTDAAVRFSISLTLTYRAGHRYCCSSPACAFHPNWEYLKERIGKAGIEVEQPLRIFLRCIVERGALFATDPGLAQTCYEPVEEQSESQHVVDELEGWDPVA
jgi:hypothetical protein